MNSFGTMIRLTTFGESHGPAMGGVLDGLSSGVYINRERVQEMLDRRRPGLQAHTSQRKESDRLELLSGISPDGITLGSPIGFIIRNEDARSSDYSEYEGKFRPNHADYTYTRKYGIHDYRGGGRASARETVNWVAAGALCREWLLEKGISVTAHAEAGGDVSAIAAAGDSIGGKVTCRIDHMPVGIGEPVFDKLHARLAYAMMSINAAKAFEYGDGISSATARGSESLDKMKAGEGGITFESNHSGGVQGGISNGMPVEFTVYFKPTPTLMQPEESVDTNGDKCVIPPRGRHDPCVALRAAAVVEAMAWLVVADLWRQSGL